MEFVFRGSRYTVARAELRVGFDCGPRLFLAFPAGPNRPASADVTDAALRGGRATLEYGGSRLDFAPLGADVAAGADPGAGATPPADGVSGIVLGDGLLTWFAARLAAPVPLLVYQRTFPPDGPGNKKGDPTGWAFLARLTENRLGPGPGPLQEQIDQALPVAACVCRPAGWDHFHFLDLLLATLGQRVPGLAGWCAVNADEQPLRFVTGTGPALALDAGWAASARCRPGRPPYGRALGPDCVLRRDFGDGAAGPADPVALLAAVARLGRPTKADDAQATGLAPADVAQLLTLPAPVKWNDKTYFAREVGLVVTPKEKEVGFRVVGEARLGSLDPGPQFLAPPPPVLLAARFEAWREADGDDPPTFARVKPDGGGWQLVGPDHRPNPDLPLLAELLLPAAPRQEFAGLYVRREEGDQLRLLIAPGAAPLALGGPQARLDELEERDLTLNAGRLALSSAPITVPLADADGVQLDRDAHHVVVQANAGDNQLILSQDDLARFTRKVRIDERLDVG